MNNTALALLLAIVASFSSSFTLASKAQAQTVNDIARRGACSTAGLEGISRQLAQAQGCLIETTSFEEFAPHRNITLTSSRVHAFLQGSARAALWSVADRGFELRVTSAFRTLADQYVLFHSGGCGLAARPGNSNHQSGRAVDISNHSAVRSAMEGAGCVWFGSRDAVHFDCPGSDRRADAIRTFQMLWNINNPSDRIAEDGLYGPQTESRLSRSPAGGFPQSGCEPRGCTAGCEGNVVVGTDCSRTTCSGANSVCIDRGAPRCGSPRCPSSGATNICLDDETQASCDNGVQIETSSCASIAAYCSNAGVISARCVSRVCVSSPEEIPRAQTFCNGNALVRCDRNGVALSDSDCPSGTMCLESGSEAMCIRGEEPPPPPMDAGIDSGPADTGPVLLDSGRELDSGMDDDGGFPADEDTEMLTEEERRRRGEALSGCTVNHRSKPGAPLVFLALALVAIARRRD